MSSAEVAMGKTVLNAAGNAAYLHQLKCWSENFDAILEGWKRAEVRAEEDRKFKAGDLLELVRTDRDGKETQPVTRIRVEVMHVERYAGPLELIGVKAGDGDQGKRTPLCVLSLAHRFEKITDTPPAAAPRAPAP